MSQRRAGIISISINGVRYDVKGAATYNLGRAKRTAIVGQDSVHGFKEEPQVAYLETKFTDRGDLDLNALVTLEGASVMCELANGKVIAFRDAWYAAEGEGSTEEAEIDARFESKDAEEIS